MTPTDAPPPPAAESDLDGFLARFESARGRGPADPADYLPPETDPLYLPVLREMVRVDLEFAWDAGGERRLEEYAGRFPRLFADPDSLRAVAWEEFRLRQMAGEAPTAAEYRERFGERVLRGRRLDLWHAAEAALRAAGVKSVQRTDLCTICNPDLFFSHRRDGKPRGVQGVLAVVT